MFTELAFSDVGVEREVVLVSQEGGDFAYREPQFEEILDALQIGVKFAFLNSHQLALDDRKKHDGGTINDLRLYSNDFAYFPHAVAHVSV